MSKQTYYLLNQEEQKVKSLRNYYVKKLNDKSLDEDKKAKYEAKLTELNNKIATFDSKHKRDNIEEEDSNESIKRLKSLRYYYVKKLNDKSLDEDKKTKYQAKLAELDEKLHNNNNNNNNLESLLQQRDKINEVIMKCQQKLQHIEELIAEYDVTTTKIAINESE